MDRRIASLQQWWRMMHNYGFRLTVAAVAAVLLAERAFADEWARFRGPNGSAVAESESIPLRWSDEENLQWKAPLPGPGSSSPIVVGGKLFVTCYSGYGVEQDGGEQKDLRRHLLCLDAESGKTLWQKDVEPVLPEDPYRGFISEHGYASSTPVSDGERVYVFFGKTGVLAFDLEGGRLWQTGVGTESGRMRWGSAASPILYKDFVIVTASEESESIRALDKQTGKEVWKAEASGLGGSWSTPVLLPVSGERRELVISVPDEAWGLDPQTGKLLWWAETGFSQPVCTSAVAGEEVVYLIGGRRGSAVAVRGGGKGDVTKSHVLWTSEIGSYVPSPVLHEGRLHWVDSNGIACCVNARDGKLVYRERLPAGGRNGVYASVVLAGERLYAVTRREGTFVLAAGDRFEQLAHNRFESDESDFNGSPAIAEGCIYLRSNRNLYCVAGEE